MPCLVHDDLHHSSQYRCRKHPEQPEHLGSAARPKVRLLCQHKTAHKANARSSSHIHQLAQDAFPVFHRHSPFLIFSECSTEFGA